MDVLKYVDILIGLAIVMLLLSPLVTGITQLILYISDTRARFLGAGLRNLLLQLDYDAVRWLKITNSAAEPVPNVSVSIPGMATLTTDATGRTKLSQTIPAARQTRYRSGCRVCHHAEDAVHSRRRSLSTVPAADERFGGA